jgi:hypothetical protein
MRRAIDHIDDPGIGYLVTDYSGSGYLVDERIPDIFIFHELVPIHC